jgi:hypothetical protein
MNVDFSFNPGFASLGSIETNGAFIVPLGITDNALTTYKVNGQPVAIRLSSMRSPVVKVETFFHTQDPSIFLSSDSTLVVGPYTYFVPTTIGTLGIIAVVDITSCFVQQNFQFRTINIAQCGAPTDAINLSFVHDKLYLFNRTTNTLFIGTVLDNGTVPYWRLLSVLTPGLVKFLPVQDTLFGLTVAAPGTGYTYRPNSQTYGVLPGPALTAFNLVSEEQCDLNRSQAVMLVSNAASQFFLAKMSLLQSPSLVLSNSFFTNAGVKAQPYDVLVTSRHAIITGNYDAANTLFTSRWDFISLANLGG